ncbi:MAG: cell division protein ZapB [Vicinamibacterales bacterium]
MIRMAKTPSTSTDLEPIDRLETKLKQLLSVVEQMKSEQTRTEAENKKLKADVESLRGHAASSESLSNEVTALREERDVIRARVGEMLSQLDALDV